MTERFNEIEKLTQPEAHDGKLNLAELLNQKGLATDGLAPATPYIDNALPHLHIDTSDSLVPITNSTLIGVGAESAAVGLWSGQTKSIEAESGKTLTTLKISDGINGAFRGLIGTVGVNIVDNELSKYYKSDLLKPSLPETIAMGAAFGLSDTRLRLAAIGGAWLLGRAYNYAEQKHQ